jgi:hypothetical protein
MLGAWRSTCAISGAFVAVAKEGRIGGAATRLFITQPALSRQIQQLEREIGEPLLVRVPHGVELTETGRELLGKARVAIEAADDALAVGEPIRMLFSEAGVEADFDETAQVYPPSAALDPGYLSVTVPVDYPEGVVRVPLVPARTLPFAFVQRAETDRSAVRAYARFAAEQLPTAYRAGIAPSGSALDPAPRRA